MLQNDMGNTLIQDSKTGHIMGLSEGFVPVGLKEHGGIMYIASVNKDGVGEIGTIPSPVLTLSLRAVDMDAVDDTLVNELGPVSIGAFISEKKIYPGEKFLPILNLQRESVNTEFFIYSVNGYQDFIGGKDLISHTGPNAYKGLYKMQLYSVYNSTNTELTHVYNKPLDVIPIQEKQDTWTGTPYWFIDGNWADIDIQQTYLNKGFLSYPGNIPPGKLLIKASLEEIDFFRPIKSSQAAAGKQKKPTLAPYVEKVFDSDTNQSIYYLHFPGFEYQTESLRFINKLDISVRNTQTGEVLFIETKTQSKDFNTVQVSNNLYQIQTGIEPIIITDQFGWTFDTPKSLCSVLINNDLNQWYELTVKYYDWCEGEIAVYKYSFNPYHVLYLEENYYNIEWYADYTNHHFSSESGSVGTIHLKEFTYTNDPIQNDFASHTFTQNDFKKDEHESLQREYDVVFTDPATSINYNNAQTKLSVSMQFEGVPDYSYLWLPQNDTALPIALPELSISIKGLDLGMDLESEQYSKYEYRGYTVTFSGANTPIKPIVTGTSSHNLSLFGVHSGYENYILKPDPKSAIVVPINDPGVIQYSIPHWWLFQLLQYSQRFSTTDIHGGSEYPPINFTVSPSGNVSYTSNSNPPPHPMPVDYVHQFTDPDYDTIIPSFSKFGYNDKNTLTSLGYNRLGFPAKAWTWDKNLLETTLIRDGEAPQNTFDSDARYYPMTSEEKQIILARSGWYLLNMDTIQQQDNATFSIKVNSDQVFKWTQEQGYFLPQLLYIPENYTMITIQWQNIDKLQGLGIYELSRDLLFVKDDYDFSKPQLIYYQDDNIVQGREPILQAAAVYHEVVECLGVSYDYYAGMLNTTMTNVKKVEDQITSFIYKYNPNNSLKTLIDGQEIIFRTLKTLE